MTESRRLDYAALNSVQRYTQWAVFRIIPGGLGVERADIISQTQDFFAQLESAGTVVVRGIYDISSIRAEADYMIWWHAENIEDIQKAYNDFRRTTVLGQVSEVFWTGTAVHRPAEFNKSHLPSFIMGEASVTASSILMVRWRNTASLKRKAFSISPSVCWSHSTFISTKRVAGADLPDQAATHARRRSVIPRQHAAGPEGSLAGYRSRCRTHRGGGAD